MKKIISVFVSILILQGCKSAKDINGQYIGKITRGGHETPSIIFIKVDSNFLKRKTNVNISINEVNINRPSTELNLLLENDNNITLNFENKTYSFDLNNSGNCYNGSNASSSLKFCYNKDEVQFDLSDKSDSSKNLKATLTKNDDLNLLNNVSNVYKVDELLGRAKFLNYTASENAQQVYRSKEQIKVSLGNLLPHVNIGDALGFATSGPVSFVSSVGNLAPFLFPSNWFQFKEAKELNKAEIKSYASLRGNIINGTEGLIYLHLRNKKLITMVQDELNWLNNVLENIKLKELAGTAPQGSSELFSLKIGTLELDLEQLKLYFDEETTELAHAVSLKIENQLEIEEPIFPEIINNVPAQSTNCIQSVQSNSFELLALDNLIKASKYQTDERIYSVLDPNGGGLGFGTPASIRIGQSYVKELQVKRNEIQSLLTKGCVDSINENNASLRSYKIADQYLKNAMKVKEILLKKMLLGDSVDEVTLDNLLSNADEILKFESQRHSALMQFIISQGKINRLMLIGNYSNLEAGI